MVPHIDCAVNAVAYLFINELFFRAFVSHPLGRGIRTHDLRLIDN
jgi:hypothetical protein